MRAYLCLFVALLLAVFFSHPVRTTAAPGSGAAELQSPVGHWKLDEGGGVTVMDSSGLGRQEAVFVPLRPTLTWNVRSVNTVLDEQALSATASVSGTFTYSPALGTVLPAGPATLHVHFEPEDQVLYSPVDMAIQVFVVEMAVPVARLGMWSYMPMAVDETRNLLYLAIPNGQGPDGFGSPDTLFVIEGSTHTVIDRKAFTKDGEVTNAAGIALDVQRNRLYVTADRDTRLWVFDATTRELNEIIELPRSESDYWYGRRVVVNPTTGLAYLSGAEKLLVVDPSRPAGDPDRVAIVPMPPNTCNGIAINPVHNLIYSGGLPDEGTCPLVVYDGDPSRPTYNTVLGILPTVTDFGARILRAFAVDRRNGKVYVVAVSGGDSPMMEVLVVEGDPALPSFHTITNAVAVDLRLGGHVASSWIPVFGLAVNANSNRLYVHTSDPRGDVGGFSLSTFDVASAQLVSIRRLPFFQNPNSYGSEPALNTATNRLYLSDGANEILVLEDAAADTIATPPSVSGEPVLVSSNQVSLTFAEVTASGTTQVQPVAASSLNLTAPGAYSIDGAQAYEVSTTASVVGPITLCFNAWHVDDADAFAALRVLHGENGTLVDRTSSHDFATRTICATVSSLSPFVIARYTEPTYGIVRLYDSARSFRAGSTAPIRLQVTDAAGLNLSAASLVVHAVELRQMSTSASAAVIDAGQSNPDQDFRFDASLGGSGGYIFNLKTMGLVTGSYELQFTVGTGQRRYSVPLQIR